MLAASRLHAWRWVAVLLALVFVGAFVVVGPNSSAQALTDGGAYAPAPAAPSDVYEQAIPPSEDVQNADYAAWEAEIANGGGIPATEAEQPEVEPSGGGSGFGVFDALEGLQVTKAGLSAYYAAQGTSLNQVICDSGAPAAVIAVASVVDGTDCSQYALANAATAAEADADASAGFSLSPVTDGTYTVSAIGAIKLSSATVGALCLSVSPAASSATSTSLYAVFEGTGVQGGVAANSVTSVAGNSLCPSGGYAIFGLSTRNSVANVQPACLRVGAPSSTSTAAAACTGGTVSTVTSSTGNPTREFVTSVVGSDGNTYTCDSATFTATDAVLPSFCSPTLPSGVGVASTSTVEHTPDGSAPDHTVSSQSTTPAYQNLVASYPDCATGACQMTVWINDQECTVGAAKCIDWQSDTTDTVVVEYGPATDPTEYQLTKAQGNILADYYDPQAQAEGQAYADPATGAKVDTQDSPDEDKATQNAPAPTVDPDGENAACWPSGWGVPDPLSWVEQPIECAFKWAFIPRPAAIEADEESITDDWDDSAPGEIATVAIPAFVVPAFDSTGCEGPEVVLNIDFWSTLPLLSGMPAVSYDGYPLSACDAPLSTLATWARLISGVALVWFGGLAVMRQIGGIVGSRGVGGEGE